MAGELAERGIRMNAVSTDLTETRQVRLGANETDSNEEDVLADWADDIPLGRLGRPQDVAGAVLFLASDRATTSWGRPSASLAAGISSSPGQRPSGVGRTR